jgi:predicted alpha/beta superfamily hydrolase
MIHQHNNFPSDHVSARHVHVWLPDDYEQQPKVQYSVLYMHDGQNLFNPKTATAGETWGVAETLSRLMNAGTIRPTLIVGIFNSPHRMTEYWPERPLTHPNGKKLLQKFRAAAQQPLSADKYLRFLVGELKPFIDRTYRTQPVRKETFIMGSSMGGLISLYALCEYPAIFQGAGCVSTHWPVVEGVIVPYLEEALPQAGQHKLYFDYGTATLDALYPPLQKPVDALMPRKGYRAGEDWLTRRFEGAEHNEPAWRARVDIPLTFLLQQS